MQPSRRAFLMGRRPPRTPWAIFCDRLQRVCAGEFKDGGADADGTGRARFKPSHAQDVRAARELCVEHSVVPVLLGPGAAAPVAYRSALYIDPANLDRLEPLPVAADAGAAAAPARWRAEPGVTMSQLVQAGLPQFAGAPPAMSLASWLAGAVAPAWPTGRPDLSGIVSLDLLLPDGAVETFGPFGADAVQPLQTATAQRLVPALFQMTSSPAAQESRTHARWPARYRLDALLPVAPASVNLGALLHGHGGTLGWVEAAVLAPVDPADPPAAAATTATTATVADDAAPTAEPAATPIPAALSLDRRIKSLFDPLDRFPEFPDAT
jgi:hypothetical protein